jgi:hypothetical protein
MAVEACPLFEHWRWMALLREEAMRKTEIKPQSSKTNERSFGVGQRQTASTGTSAPANPFMGRSPVNQTVVQRDTGRGPKKA